MDDAQASEEVSWVFESIKKKERETCLGFSWGSLGRLPKEIVIERVVYYEYTFSLFQTTFVIDEVKQIIQEVSAFLVLEVDVF